MTYGYIGVDVVEEHLVPILEKYEVLVRFVKKDETEREIRGTLCPNLIPDSAFKDFDDPIRKPKPNVQVIYDLDAKAFRSFRKAYVLGYTTNIKTT